MRLQRRRLANFNWAVLFGHGLGVSGPGSLLGIVGMRLPTATCILQIEQDGTNKWMDSKFCTLAESKVLRHTAAIVYVQS